MAKKIPTINDEYKELLTEAEISNIYKRRRKRIGQYLSTLTENNHLKLNKFMITLNPRMNDYGALAKLRKHFMTKLRNKATNGKTKQHLAYFSAIEVDLNKNPIDWIADKNQIDNLEIFHSNLHIHFQLLTELSKFQVYEVIQSLDYVKYCFDADLKESYSDYVKHDYVIKEIKVVDFKTLYYRIKRYPKANMHTMSRKKSFPNYVITKIWDYMDTMHPQKWNNIADGFSFILDAKKINDVVFDKQDKDPNKKYNLLKVNNYNKSKVHTIFISKTIL